MDHKLQLDKHSKCLLFCFHSVGFSGGLGWRWVQPSRGNLWSFLLVDQSFYPLGTNLAWGYFIFLRLPTWGRSLGWNPSWGNLLWAGRRVYVCKLLSFHSTQNQSSRQEQFLRAPTGDRSQPQASCACPDPGWMVPELHLLSSGSPGAEKNESCP